MGVGKHSRKKTYLMAGSGMILLRRKGPGTAFGRTEPNALTPGPRHAFLSKRYIQPLPLLMLRPDKIIILPVIWTPGATETLFLKPVGRLSGNSDENLCACMLYFHSVERPKNARNLLSLTTGFWGRFVSSKVVKSYVYNDIWNSHAH